MLVRATCSSAPCWPERGSAATSTPRATTPTRPACRHARCTGSRSLAFVISGVLSAIAGFILTARLGTAQPTAGTGLELAAIAAVIIGGTSLAGGRGALVGTRHRRAAARHHRQRPEPARRLAVPPGGRQGSRDPRGDLPRPQLRPRACPHAGCVDVRAKGTSRTRRTPSPSTNDSPTSHWKANACEPVPRRPSSIASSLAVMAALAGCGRGEAASTTTDATLVISTLNNPFFVSVADGAKAKAEELGRDPGRAERQQQRPDRAQPDHDGADQEPRRADHRPGRQRDRRLDDQGRPTPPTSRSWPSTGSPRAATSPGLHRLRRHPGRQGRRQGARPRPSARRARSSRSRASWARTSPRTAARASRAASRLTPASPSSPRRPRTSTAARRSTS